MKTESKEFIVKNISEANAKLASTLTGILAGNFDGEGAAYSLRSYLKESHDLIFNSMVHLSAVIADEQYTKKSLSEMEKISKSCNFETGKTWSGLRKAWKSYRLAKVRDNDIKMREAANKIREIQRELGVSVASFPHLGIN